MLFLQIIHLLIERVPSPFPLLRLNRAPTRLARPVVCNTNRGKLRNPSGIGLRRSIVRMATANAEGTLRDIGVRLLLRVYSSKRTEPAQEAERRKAVHKKSFHGLSEFLILKAAIAPEGIHRTGPNAGCHGAVPSAPCRCASDSFEIFRQIPYATARSRVLLLGTLTFPSARRGGGSTILSRKPDCGDNA